jgi:hypothetical protein
VNKQVRPADIVTMASGAVALIFSFFAWFEIPGGFEGDDQSGWGEGIFPLGTYIGIIGLLLALQVALDRFANVNFPERVVSFTWTQVHLALSVFATLIALGYLVLDDGGYDRGIGLWFSILAAIGLLVGSIMRYAEGEREVTPGGQPPTPF